MRTERADEDRRGDEDEPRVVAPEHVEAMTPAPTLHIQRVVQQPHPPPRRHGITPYAAKLSRWKANATFEEEVDESRNRVDAGHDPARGIA